MTADEIKQKHRIEDVLSQDGIKLVGGGKERTTNRCAMMEHKPGHQCVSVNVDKQVWRCHDCGKGGDVIEWFALSWNITAGEVLKKFGALELKTNGAPRVKSIQKTTSPAGKIKAVYQYHDALGEVVFEVVRFENPKDFRQRHMVNGEWVWNMDGVERVLYHLPEVTKATTVWITEGEKDADNLRALGYSVTCNVGGAKKWMDGYTDSLAGKNIAICGDTDQAGQEHVKKVFDSIAGHVPDLRIIKIPPPHKDASDWIEAGAKKEDFDKLYNDAVVFTKGVHLEIYSMADLEEMYSKYASALDQHTFKLGTWLPSLGKCVRRLVPGELIMFLGATGVGKTAILSNIALHALMLPTLYFQLELAAEMMFERLVATKAMMGTEAIEKIYAKGGREGREWMMERFPKLYISTRPKLTVDAIAKTINVAELRMGEKPKLVLVDYMQLVQGHGQTRYDRFSSIAEELKVMSKETGTILICSSQVQRKKDDDRVVRLTDAKESGSIENSSGIVFGAWREDDRSMTLEVLKNKGPVGQQILCNYDERTLLITERAITN